VSEYFLYLDKACSKEEKNGLISIQIIDKSSGIQNNKPVGSPGENKNRY